MYSVIILCENAAVERTVLPEVVKQNDVSQNTRKKGRISIKDLKILGKNDAFQLKWMR